MCHLWYEKYTNDSTAIDMFNAYKDYTDQSQIYLQDVSYQTSENGKLKGSITNTSNITLDGGIKENDRLCLIFMPNIRQRYAAYIVLNGYIKVTPKN